MKCLAQGSNSLVAFTFLNCVLQYFKVLPGASNRRIVQARHSVVSPFISKGHIKSTLEAGMRGGGMAYHSAPTKSAGTIRTGSHKDLCLSKGLQKLDA